MATVASLSPFPKVPSLPTTSSLWAGGVGETQARPSVLRIVSV